MQVNLLLPLFYGGLIAVKVSFPCYQLGDLSLNLFDFFTKKPF